MGGRSQLLGLGLPTGSLPGTLAPDPYLLTPSSFPSPPGLPPFAPSSLSPSCPLPVPFFLSIHLKGTGSVPPRGAEGLVVVVRTRVSLKLRERSSEVWTPSCPRGHCVSPGVSGGEGRVNWRRWLRQIRNWQAHMCQRGTVCESESTCLSARPHSNISTNKSLSVGRNECHSPRALCAGGRCG